MIYLLSPNKKQYRANLHCHSVLSDGKRTPAELKELYKANGYSILAVTDHESPGTHQELNDDDFIMITGYEAHVRAGKGKFNQYGPEIHMNLFAEDPNSMKIVNYDPDFCGWAIRDGREGEFERVGLTGEREYSVEYINNFIKIANENGYIVSYNHPYWSLEEESTILSYEGIFSLEIINGGSDMLSGIEYSGALYDRMLRRGKRVYCHGGDDSHGSRPVDDPYFDSFGGYTMIMPDEFTYDGIYRAMKTGEMYASRGPRIFEISVDGDNLHIECSPVSHIYSYMGSKRTKNLHAPRGGSITSADFKIDEGAKFIRVSVFDEHGKSADSRGYFPEEFGREGKTE